MSTIANLSIGISGDTAQLGAAIGRAKAYLTDLGSSAIAATGSLVGSLAGNLQDLTVSLVDNVAASLNESGGEIVGWTQNLGGYLGGVMGPIGSSAGALLGVSIGQGLEMVGVGGAVEKIRAVATQAGEGAFDALRFAAEEAAQASAEALGYLIDSMGDLEEITDGLTGKWQSWGEITLQALKAVLVGCGYMADAATVAFGAIQTGFGVVVTTIGTLTRAFGGAVSALDSLGEATAVATGYVVDAFKAIPAVVSIAVGEIVELFGEPILGALKGVAEALSKVFPDNFGGDYFKSVAESFDAMAANAKQVGRQLKKEGRENLEAFGQGADAALESYKQTFGSVMSQIVGGIDTAGRALENFGVESALHGLDLVKNAWGKNAGDIAGIMDGLIDRYQFKGQKKEEEEEGEEEEAKRQKAPAHAAVERGSAEAFKIIAGAQGDKMYKVANDQLKVAIESRNALIELLKKRGGHGPNIRRGEL